MAMKETPKRQSQERSWAELCCLQLPSWSKQVLRKWLNVSSGDSDFSADENEEFDSENHHEYEDMCGWERDVYNVGRKINQLVSNASTSQSVHCKIRRRKSEILRAQYINNKELRICVGTWNVGGRSPPDDLEIDKWLNMEEPADIYVLGFQEIVPLNAGNIFGAEDNRPISKWESIIRETLNRTSSVRGNFKCHVATPSPSRSEPADDTTPTEEISLDTDTDSDDEVHPLDNRSFDFHSDSDHQSPSTNNLEDVHVAGTPDEGLERLEQHGQTPKALHRLNKFKSMSDDPHTGTSDGKHKKIPLRSLSKSEKIGLSWPEQPLNILPLWQLYGSNSSKGIQSLSDRQSYEPLPGDDKHLLQPEFYKRNSIRLAKKRSAFVRIISKQMVGIFLTVWVRRSLRKHIQNLKVSTVGVGAMGYMGNKGSVSVSMSIYQTFVCFVCTHLASGDKAGDELRRNSDVQEIHRKTQFNGTPGIVTRAIFDHERIIWLGDLNYRINLPYEDILQHISNKEWSKLVEMDQLTHELKKGRAFDGWTEGVLNFAPTFKYEFGSDKYIGENPAAGRRTPAWCDRILSFGQGMRLLSYKRSEYTLSDHRPVTAFFTAEVEVFCHRKLQKALTFTDAEVEDFEILSEYDKGGN